MPLYRRIPKWGFKNPFRRQFEVVNLQSLDAHFSNGEVVDPEKLVQKGLIRHNAVWIKVLGDGNLAKSLTVKAHGFSKSAIQKINQAGGQIEEIKPMVKKAEDK